MSRPNESEKLLEMLYAAQIRAARALLGWRQEDLSEASGVGTATIYRLEKTDGPVLGNVSTVLKLQKAFEEAGVQFIEKDEAGGIGVRFQLIKRHRLARTTGG